MSFYSSIVAHLDFALKQRDAVALAQAARDFAAFVGAAFEPGSVTAPPLDHPAISEAETRKLYVDAYLEEACTSLWTKRRGATSWPA